MDSRANPSDRSGRTTDLAGSVVQIGGPAADTYGRRVSVLMAYAKHSESQTDVVLFFQRLELDAGDGVELEEPAETSSVNMSPFAVMLGT